MKKFLFMLFLISRFLTVTFAADGQLSGSGTDADPYVIEDYADLKAVNLYGLDKVYRLANDIDASASLTDNDGTGFESIGPVTRSGSTIAISPFRGKFKGDGYVIRNLYINRPEGYYVGLFSQLDNECIIENLGIINGNIVGYEKVGGIVGHTEYNSEIINCYFIGEVECNNEYAGGIAGYLGGAATQCFTSGKVNGNTAVGGLAGMCNWNILVSRCYSSADVSGTTAIGGLIGLGMDFRIEDCYATGSVFGGKNSGGLIGFSRIIHIDNCYAAGKVSGTSEVGGLVGYNDRSVATNCFFNNQMLSRGVLEPGTAIGTSDMKKQSTYAEWDFESVWMITEGSSYPGLKGLNNAPFGFNDTLFVDQTVDINNILENDVDIEDSTLTFKIIQVTGPGITDSISWFNLPSGTAPDAYGYFIYRPGEILQDGNILWGNQALVKLQDVNFATALPDKESEQTEILCYPNPFTDHIYILVGHELVKLEVMSDTGRLLIEKEIAGPSTLSLPGLPAGTYFVRIGNNIFKLLKN